MGSPSRADLSRVRQLLRATARLSSAITEVEVAEIMLGEGTETLAARTAAIWRVEPDGLALIGARGYSADEERLVRRLPLVPEVPIAAAVLGRAPVWITSRADYRERFPRSAGRTAAAATSDELAVACVPLVGERDVLGVIAFAFFEERAFDPDERAFIELIAQHCAQGLQRADLYDAERAAREHAEEARRLSEESRERSAFLAQAGALLSTSLDYETTLRSVAMLAVPRIADWCAIEMGTPEASAQVAVAHVDPSKVAMAAELRERYPPDRAQPRGAHHVIRTGVSELYPDVTEDMLLAGAQDAEHLRITRALGLRSALVVPIRSHDRVLGAITFVSAETGRRYGPDDVAMAAQLGDRAGMAIANAQLYAAERRTRGRIAKLQQATAAFAAARTLDEVGEVTVELAVSVVAASRIMLWQLDAEAATLVLLSARGLDDASRVQAERIALDAPWPVAEVARTGEARFYDEAAVRRLGTAATVFAGAAIPLIVQDRRVGVLGIAFGEPRDFVTDERDFLRAIADQCAQAMDRVRAYEESVRAVAARDDFLSIAGHELRTPLTAIHLQLHSIQALARDPQAPPRLLERSAKAYAQSQRLARLIDQLLDVSRVARGRLELDREEVDLSALVGECVTRLDEELRRSGSEVRVAIAPGQRGQWDRLRLDQVVTNLVANAIKYGAGKPIDVVVESHGPHATVVVHDRGIGIDPAAQQRIFERFERAVSSRHYGGLGLGLWISRQIVEAHGGTISVLSAPGEGARFEVRLPWAPLPTP